jgi:hypothetical protein
LPVRGRCGSRPSSTTPDIGVLRRLEHFSELTAKARDVNRRLMQTVRAGQGCVLARPAIERIAQPTLTEDGRRAPALHVDDYIAQARLRPAA